MKKISAFILIIIILTCFCSCKARTGYSERSESKKGAREVSEIPEDTREPEPSSQSESEPEPENELDSRPEELVAAMFAAAQTGERERIQPYADYNTLLMLQQGQNAEQHFKQLLAYMNWEVLSSETQTGDRVLVSAKLTNIDMAVVLPIYLQKAMELEFENAGLDEPLDAAELEPQYTKLFSDLLSERKSGTVERLVDVELQKSGDDWSIIPDYSLSDAMLGGYFTARSLVTGQMGQQPETPME